MSLIGKTYAERMYNFFMPRVGNLYGVAGLYGNWKAECVDKANNLQNSFQKKLGHTDESYTTAVDNGTYTNFVHDGAGYGSAQWTLWERKQALLDFARKKGVSIGDEEMQFEFAWQELTTGYKGVLKVMQAAKSVREASDVVLKQYEKPADQSEAVQKKRASYGEDFYKQFAQPQPVAVEPQNPVTASKNQKITTGAQLADAALRVARNYKTLYIMGCFGAPMTAANKRRYTSNHAYNRDPQRTAMINAASADTFGFDCVCLIKGLLWGWSGDTGKSYGGAAYNSNGVPDIGADQMIGVCSGVSTDFSNIEIGEAVWMKGHIGIYVGDGLAVECTPKWSNNVQVTAVLNIGGKNGYNGRKWTKHGKLPYVSYTAGGAQPAPAQPVKTSFKVGDIVTYKGNTHYTSSNAATPKGCKLGRAKVTAVAKGAKHPYHLIAEKGGGSTVYGWVNTSDIAMP